MSRRPLQTLILLLLAVTLFASCKKKQQAETTADSTLILNEQLATEFAQKIEAIEKQKELVKQSIVETETLFNSRMDYWFN